MTTNPSLWLQSLRNEEEKPGIYELTNSKWFIQFSFWINKTANISLNLIDKKVTFISQGINIQMSNDDYIYFL